MLKDPTHARVPPGPVCGRPGHTWRSRDESAAHTLAEDKNKIRSLDHVSDNGYFYYYLSNVVCYWVTYLSETSQLTTDSLQCSITVPMAIPDGS